VEILFESLHILLDLGLDGGIVGKQMIADCGLVTQDCRLEFSESEDALQPSILDLAKPAVYFANFLQSHETHSRHGRKQDKDDRNKLAADRKLRKHRCAPQVTNSVS
jgi:hypothetical protein